MFPQPKRLALRLLALLLPLFGCMKPNPLIDSSGDDSSGDDSSGDDSLGDDSLGDDAPGGEPLDDAGAGESDSGGEAAEDESGTGDEPPASEDETDTGDEPADGGDETDTGDEPAEGGDEAGDDEGPVVPDLPDEDDDFCAPLDAFSPDCGSCLSIACCETALECASLDDCVCLAECLLAGGKEGVCKTMCGGAKAEEIPELQPLLACASDMCAASC